MIDLDGIWEFQHDPAGILTAADLGPMRAIIVPGPWQGQFDDLREVSGVGWYRRTFAVPAAWGTSLAFLSFGAVDYFAEVWVNGVRIGAHEGGYLPFTFEVQDQLRFGELNELVVRVVDVGADTFDRFPEFQFADIPHGKQNWYGPTGGIWQSVRLEQRGVSYVRELRLTADPSGEQVEVRFELAYPALASTASVIVTSPREDTVASTLVPIDSINQSYAVFLPIPSPSLWDVDAPNLYRCTIQILVADAIIDEKTDRFGFRTIETRGGSILLNGRPIYLRGALDQDYYPETICTPPSENFLRDRFVKAKELGLNCLRCHIKIPDPRYYALADELGLLIWTDLPSWGARIKPEFGYGERSEVATTRALETMEGMIRRDWNHPSIICWTIVNEDWGTKLATSAADRAWLRATYDWVRAIDSHRLVVDNSPCAPNFHVKSDLDDYHFYRSIPDHAAQWSATVEDFASRPAWSYSQHGDAVRRGDEPLVVSEFGNWGLPDVHRLFDYYGGEPWWFHSGEKWGRDETQGLVHPRGVLERFAALGLESVFGSYQSFIRASQDGERAALAYEIESMRRHDSIKGYVITELTDVHWECNGLLDLCSGPKSFHETFATINADDVIVASLPAPGRRSFWEGEAITFELMVSHFSRAGVDGAVVSWQLRPTTPNLLPLTNLSWPAGCLPSSLINFGRITRLGDVTIAAPAVDRPIAMELYVRLDDANGAILASCALDLYLYPRAAGRAAANRKISLTGNSSATALLATRLQSLGYEICDDPRDCDVAIARGYDAAVEDLIQDGGRVLVVCESKTDRDTGLYQIVERSGTGFDGDWASNFNWLNPGLLSHRIPSGPRLDWAFASVAPDRVITGLSMEQIARDGLAGLFLGWIQKPAGLAFQFRRGTGTGVVTTLRVTEPHGLNLGEDPAAPVLLGDLIEHLATGQCQPSAD